MKTTILLAFLSLTPFCIPSAYGQMNEWTQQFGTSEFDIPYGVSADGLGNVYITGSTSGSLDGTNAGKRDAFISKYDSSGTIQWTQQFGNSENDGAYGVSADGLGNVYFTSSIATFFPEQGGYTTSEYFINKYDSSGTLQWTRSPSLIGDPSVSHVSADVLGNVYISGSIVTPNFDYDAFIAKYNANGTLQWSQQLGTSENDFSNDVSADGLGNVYISGTTHGDLAGTNAGIYDTFLTKYDSSGSLQWSQQLGTSGEDFSNGVSADGLGNVFIAGRTTGSLDGTNAGGSDTYVANYDSSGSLQWIQQLGTTEFEQTWAVSADELGGVFITGRTTGSLDGTNAGDNDAYVANYDSSGTLQWIQQFGTSERDGGVGVSADGLGNVYFAGYSEGSLAAPNAGNWDVLVAKFNNLPVPPDPTADFNSDTRVDGDDLAIWDSFFGTPNPFGSPVHEFGDADEDGDIDGHDFLIWQREYGLGVASTASSANVPEPSTSLLTLAAFAPLMLAWRLHSKRLTVRNNTYHIQRL